MESFLFDQGSDSNSSSSDHGNHELINPLFIPNDFYTSSNPASDGYACDNYDYNNPVLKYISDILLEEDNEDNPSMLQDCLALQAAEKSFYDVLHQNELAEVNPYLLQRSDDSREGIFNNGRAIYGVVDPSKTCHVQSSLIDLARYQLQGPQTLMGSNSAYEQQSNGYSSENYGSKAKKNLRRRDDHCLEEWRSNKQSVAYCADDSELHEMFDKALLFQIVNDESVDSSSHHESSNTGSMHPIKGSKLVRPKRQSKEEKVVDLHTMLIQCAQAIASYDQRNACELLKQIRRHSSPYGDATQRLAHYFADGLEVRLTGTRAPSYSPLVSVQISTAEIMKGFQTYITAFPLRTLPQFFANMTIMKLAEMSTSLHIIDFGTSYGFQWPSLIQWLSERPGGPPKLRITAIELPQPGFRPTKRIEETGRRLAKYSARFGVPFEFHVVAQKWETIRFDDLKIDRNKLIVVNCLERLRHVPEVTMMGNSPRDVVLKLIWKINPEIFINGVVNGAYNSSFFPTRFKQALFFFNAIFDIFEATVPCEDEQRLFIEKTGLAKDIMNVVACEGLEVIERPETYQKWQIRNVRAGFKKLLLDQELLKKVKIVSKLIGYHNDFSIDEDENWMLQGWRGRVLMALSFWKGK